MSPELSARLKTFREERQVLYEAVTAVFKKYDAVQVDCDRYRGTGIYIMTPYEDPSWVEVRLENGNTWRYPAETVQVIELKSQSPSFRRDYLRFRGVACSGVSHHRTLKGKLP